MPTVIGTNEVSGGIPKNSWYNDLGRISGRTTEKGVDALLAFFTAGMAQGGQQPIQTSQNPGSLSFPGGQSTPTSPAEMEQIRRMGGIPTTSGGITPVGRPGASQPRGVNYVPPIPQNAQQTKYLKDLAEIDPNSALNLQRKAAADIAKKFLSQDGYSTPQYQPNYPQQTPQDNAQTFGTDLTDITDDDRMALHEAALDPNDPDHEASIQYLKAIGEY